MKPRRDCRLASRVHRVGAFLAALLWLPISAAYARDFVVDNQHPDAADTNPGCAEAPLKTIQRAADIVQPGDRVIVKAGRYPEGVRFKTSGTSQKHIVFVGAGGHATLLDGADVMTGWQRCKSPTECGGNANFAELYWTWLPEGNTAFSANLYEGESMLVLAQDPPAPDPFYYDDRSVRQTTGPDASSSVTNNLYTKLSWVQKPDTLGENAIIEGDLKKIFVDPDEGDYHLRSSSPARDAGTQVPVAEDIDEVKRPQGKAFDIGAYEYRP